MQGCGQLSYLSVYHLPINHFEKGNKQCNITFIQFLIFITNYEIGGGVVWGGGPGSWIVLPFFPSNKVLGRSSFDIGIINFIQPPMFSTFYFYFYFYYKNKNIILQSLQTSKSNFFTNSTIYSAWQSVYIMSTIDVTIFCTVILFNYSFITYGSIIISTVSSRALLILFNT